MRLLLTLNSGRENQIIPINYQYPIAAAIYKILQKADAQYSSFLHERGYGKGFKLFTFSDIRCPFKINGDRLVLQSDKATIVVCFHLPRAAETFVKGLFISQQIDIADKKSKTNFRVEQVESLTQPFELLNGNPVIEIVVQPLSAVVCGLKDEKGNYSFLSPEDARFEEMIFLNWKEKCKSVWGEEETLEGLKNAFVQTLFFKNPPRSRLITIKSGTDAETKIRGFNNFKLNIRGNKEAIQLILDSGIGLYNAQGMGCVGIVQP